MFLLSFDIEIHFIFKLNYFVYLTAKKKETKKRRNINQVVFLKLIAKFNLNVNIKVEERTK